MRRNSLLLICLLVVTCATVSPAAAQTVISDDFESYTVGNFPSPDWLDAGLVLNPPLVPIPSCVIESTPGPDGGPTQVVSTVEFMGPSQGFYRFIPVSDRYIVSADVRIDRFTDNPGSAVSHWTWEVGVGKFRDGVDLGLIPQVGIYGSAFTGGWRLFVAGTDGTFVDIDLSLPVDLGRWYHVEMDLDARAGVTRCRISDAITDEILVDQINIIAGWTPADGLFDIVNFFESDVLVKGTTVSNLCVIDNISATMIGDPCPADFNGDGVVDSLDFLAFLNAFVAGCP